MIWPFVILIAQLYKALSTLIGEPTINTISFPTLYFFKSSKPLIQLLYKSSFKNKSWHVYPHKESSGKHAISTPLEIASSSNLLISSTL